MPFHQQHLAALKELVRDPHHRADCVQLIGAAFNDDPGLDRLESILDAIHEGSAAGLPTDGWSEIDAIFLSGLARLIDPPPSQTREPHPDIRHSSLQEDALVAHSRIEDWTMLQAIHYALLMQIHPKERVAALVTMRDDGVSILEWVAHYRALEFDNIFVYTNDNADGSEALLEALADAGLITVIWNSTSGTVSPQQKAYDHSLHLLPELRDYEWVFYLDSDEFLELGPEYGNSIQRLIDHVEEKFPASLPSAIGFHWQWFGSGDVYDRRPGLLLEKFQHAASNNHVKSLVRLADVTSMAALHYPELAVPGFMVNSALQRVRLSAIHEGDELSYQGGRIRHYWVKSFEEFSVKKARGDSLSSGPGTDAYKRDFIAFFEWNVQENQDNRFPPPESLVEEVKSELAFLLTVPGVTEAAGKIEAGFAGLISRYDAAGGLRSIYDACLAKHSHPDRPADETPPSA